MLLEVISIHCRYCLMSHLRASGRECRLDDLILEAITKLKEPRGSSRPAVAQYIEVMIFYLCWICVRINDYKNQSDEK